MQTRMRLAAASTSTTPIPWVVWRLSGVIVFGAFMSGLDGSVVSVALATLSQDLDADLAATQWVANGYLLALAGSLPACAWASRRFGAGTVWLVSLAAFTLASGLCALATSVEALIGLRVLQGLAAGLLIPAGQTVLGQAVGPDRLGRVMATLGVAVTLAPVLGPVVGGIVLHLAPWPWLFLINLPIGAAGLLLGWHYVPRGSTAAAGRLDVTGLVLVSIGLPLLVYALTAWSERRNLVLLPVGLPLAAGVVLLTAFVFHTRKVPAPVLQLRLFRQLRFTAAVTVAGLAGASLFGAALLLPLYFQLGQSRDVLATGLLLISSGVGTAMVLPWAGRLTDRYGGGPVAVVGAAVLLATTLPFAVLPLDARAWTVQLLLALRGMATALAVVPATTEAYRAVDPDDLPDAATHVNIVQRVSGALSGAVFAVIVATQLSDDPALALHTAFWWLAGTCAAGLAAAVWLAAVTRRPPTLL